METLFFEKDFFKPETKENFYVEGMMKRAWAAQLEVLVRIDALCKEHHIRWFADCGTLLGAIRHKGFIPWDDDLDISMLRPDYEKFLKIAKEHLPEGYSLLDPNHSIESDIRSDILKSHQPFARIVNSTQINYSDEFLLKNHSFPYPAGIDIFPLDGLPNDPEERELLISICCKVIAANASARETDGSFDEEKLQEIEELCDIKIDRSSDVLFQLHTLLNHLGKAYEVSDSRYISSLAFINTLKNPVWEKDWFQDITMMPFENIEVPCPAGYHEYLTAYYGEYMTPVTNLQSHEYPYYKGMFMEAEENTDENIQEREKKFAEHVSVNRYEIKELSTFLKTTMSDYFLYFYDGSHYVYRIPDKEPLPFLNWSREKRVYEAVEKLRLTENPVYFDEVSGEKIIPFLKNGSFLQPDNEEQLFSSIELLRAMHQLEFQGEAGSSPVTLLDFYEKNVRPDSYKEFYEYREQIHTLIRYLKNYPVHTGLVHMNPSKESFYFCETETGLEGFLLDLKYAGTGDTDWDLGILAANMLLEPEEIPELVVCYYGETKEEEAYAQTFEKICIYTVIASYMKGIQYKLLSRLQEDFRKKSDEHLKQVKKLLSEFEA